MLYNKTYVTIWMQTILVFMYNKSYPNEPDRLKRVQLANYVIKI